MTKVPSCDYNVVVNVLKRDGWLVVRQKGSHIRLQKRLNDEVLKLTIPAHKPIFGPWSTYQEHPRFSVRCGSKR